MSLINVWWSPYAHMQRYLLPILYTHWSVQLLLKSLLYGREKLCCEYWICIWEYIIWCITSCSKLAIFILVQSFNFCSRSFSWFSFCSMSVFFKCISLVGPKNSRGTVPDDTFLVNSVSLWTAWLHVCPGGSFLRIRNKWEMPHTQLSKTAWWSHKTTCFL